MSRRAMLAAAALGASVLAVAGTATAGDPHFEPTATSREMVVTANPLATDAAAKVLQTGGTAADAMIAAQTVLGLVEPQQVIQFAFEDAGAFFFGDLFDFLLLRLWLFLILLAERFEHPVVLWLFLRRFRIRLRNL